MSGGAFRGEPLASVSQPLSDQLQRLRLEQERLFERLQQGEAHFRGLARSVWRVQEDERRRVARDLHDGVGQNLTALLHRLESLSVAQRTDGGWSALAGALELCSQALEEVRALSRRLRPQILDDLGLVAALQWLGRSTFGEHAVQFTLEVEDGLESLDGEFRTLFFRVAQEALSNVLRHADASNVALRMFNRNGQVVLLVVDDGRGCAVDAALARGSEGLSTGLSSLRERVQLFGGSFEFSSSDSDGTCLRISIPVDGQSEAA